MRSSLHRLFIVEDHPAMRRMMRRLIETTPGLGVLGEAASAEEALASLSGLAPDLLLVDLSLPGMSGIEFVRRLRLERPELRCLVVTAHADELYRHSALAAGASGYVTKDDPDEVLAMVWQLLPDGQSAR